MRQVDGFPLWLGNAHDAHDYVSLFDAGIQAVVDLAIEERPGSPPRELIWLRYPLLDGAGNPPARLRGAVAAVIQLMKDEIPTLIACGAGMSRTPAVAAVALAMLRNEAPSDWLSRLVEGVPHDVAPSLWRDVIAATSGRWYSKSLTAAKQYVLLDFERFRSKGHYILG